jgi:hypothetical protein
VWLWSEGARWSLYGMCRSGLGAARSPRAGAAPDAARRPANPTRRQKHTPNTQPREGRDTTSTNEGGEGHTTEQGRRRPLPWTGGGEHTARRSAHDTSLPAAAGGAAHLTDTRSPSVPRRVRRGGLQPDEQLQQQIREVDALRLGVQLEVELLLLLGGVLLRGGERGGHRRRHLELQLGTAQQHRGHAPRGAGERRGDERGRTARALRRRTVRRTTRRGAGAAGAAARCRRVELGRGRRGRRRYVELGGVWRVRLRVRLGVRVCVLVSPRLRERGCRESTLRVCGRGLDGAPLVEEARSDVAVPRELRVQNTREQRMLNTADEVTQKQRGNARGGREDGSSTGKCTLRAPRTLSTPRTRIRRERASPLRCVVRCDSASHAPYRYRAASTPSATARMCTAARSPRASWSRARRSSACARAPRRGGARASERRPAVRRRRCAEAMRAPSACARRGSDAARPRTCPSSTAKGGRCS